MLVRSLVLACATVAALTHHASAAITLDAAFDNGSLKSYSVSGTTVTLVGRDNYYGSGQWRWLNAKVSGVASVKPTFRISDNFAGGAAALNSHPMVYSYDGVTWNFFDNNARSGGFYSFSNNAAFTSANVQIAYAIPYSYGKSVTHAQQVIASPWGAPTLTGNASGVIGQSPGGVDDLGRTIAPRDIYAYRITNPAYDLPGRTKHKAVISTGLHAGETLGTHTYQGFIDWLIGTDPRAAVLRGVAEFYGYPTLNPDGRFAGYNRTTVANSTVDPNGLWSPTNWAPANRKEIKVNGEAMIADIAQTAAPVQAFIDFHSTIPAYPNEDFGYLEYEQGDNLAPWWVKFKQLAGTVVDDDSTGTSWTSANFAEAYLGAQVDVTFETQFGRRRNVDYYNNLGKQLGIAFYESWKPKDGDTNFDGTVNFTDLLKLAANYGNATAGGFEAGDFNFDGTVNFTDLLALASNYGSTSGTLASDFALAQAMVPEPSGFASAAALVLLRRKRPTT
ncbi:MAG: M14 family zinc carboxypeptidase [Tepidisphaeraceae bacterium]